MAEASYFVGVEFDWLRSQVAAVMWNPGGYDDLARHEHMSASGARVKVSEAIKRKPQAAPPPYQEREGAVTRTWRSTAPNAAAMSVEDYNRWRGESPANAAAAPYVFQKYPTTLYKDGNRIKVGNAEDHDRLADEGWKESP